MPEGSRFASLRGAQRGIGPSIILARRLSVPRGYYWGFPLRAHCQCLAAKLSEGYPKEIDCR